MNFKLFSVLSKENKAAFSAQSKVQKIISALMGESKEFEVFEDAALLADAVNNSAADCDIVIIAAEKKMYPVQKDALIASTGCFAKTDKRIFSILMSSENNEYVAESMAFIPVNSTVMPSDDFIYNGFVVKEENRYLVFIPLDTRRLDRIMKNGLFGFLKLAGQNKDLDFEQLKPLLDAELDGVEFPSEALQDKKEKSPDSNTLLDKEQIFSLFTNMKDKGWHIAVADTALANVFESTIEQTAFVKQNLISFEPCKTEIGSDDRTVSSNTAVAASEARKVCGAEVGVAISDICVSGSEGRYIAVALANESTARVRKIFANDGEKKISLIKEAITQLFCLMIDYTSDHGVPPEDADIIPVDSFDEGQIPVNKRRRALIWVLICIFAVLAGCVIVTLCSERARAAVFSVISPVQESVGVTEYTTFVPADDSIMDISIYDVLLGDISFVEAGDYEFFQEDVRGYEQEDETTAEPLQSETQTAVSATTEKTTAEEITKEVTVTQSTTAVTTRVVTTTAAVTTTEATTAKPTTTRPKTTVTTTEKKTSTTAADKEPELSVKFTFSTKGYGHGVGMSQDGAIAYAKSGWTYDQILLHYYNGGGISIATDGILERPLTVSYDNQLITLKEYLVRVALAEIGFPKSGVPDEAFKAQIVAIYTYAKDKGFSLKKDNHAYLSDEKYVKYINSQTEKDHIYDLAESVLGKYVAYNGKAAFTPYFANSAGSTVSADTVWGGSPGKYPYLSGGRKSIESPTAGKVEISAEDFKSKVEEYNVAHPDTAITLGSDPTNWIKVVERDSSGYVTKIRVGNKEFRGSTFRSDIMQYGIKSHCFTVSCG